MTRTDTSEPLRRAEIAAFPTGGYTSFDELVSAVSDADGRFELPNLSPGSYFIKAVRGGFVETWYGQALPGHPKQNVRVLGNDSVVVVNIVMSPAATISGQVVDDFGEPISRMAVHAVRRRFNNGLPELVPIGTIAAPTDDEGQFRVEGLPPGDYLIVAGPDTTARLAGDVGFAPTFYPGATNFSDATPVRVGSGQQVSGLRFSPSAVRPATIRGIVQDTNGKPVARGTVSVSRRTVTGGVSGLSETRDGTFLAENLPPGDYTVSATIQTDRGMRQASVELKLLGEDVNLVLQPRPDVVISGRVQISGNRQVQPGEILVQGNASDDPKRYHSSFNARVNPDWTFQASVPAGLGWFIRVVGPKGFETQAIRFLGVDIVDRPIVIDANIIGAEINLTGNTATVTGSVASSGDSMSSASVIAFSVTEEGWTPFSRRIKRTTIDATGRFTLDSLLEGDYAFAAVPRLEEGEETNPSLLRVLLPLAVKGRISAGQRSEIVVPMTTPP